MITTIPITVTIPVGPNPANKRWLGEAINSVLLQHYRANEILLIDDQAGLRLEPRDYNSKTLWIDDLEVQVPDHINLWKTPWQSGVAHAFNFGVALARNDLVVMLGSDDLLQPWALSDLKATVERWGDPLGYYWYDIEYMDTGETQHLPCHGAAITKQLMKHTGGFPVESAIGQPDTMLISIMLAHPEAGRLISVDSKVPPYRYRRHPESDTGTRPAFPFSVVRDILTEQWRPRT